MTSIPARAAQSMINSDSSAWAEFEHIRSEVLPSQRRELSLEEYERSEYDGFRTLGPNVPFLCRREWLPNAPVVLPLPCESHSVWPVRFTYESKTEQPRNSDWTDGIRIMARTLLPSTVSSYAEAIERSNRIGSLYNGVCYRLIGHKLLQGVGEGARLNSGLCLTFTTCGYFDYLNTTEILSHEAARENGRAVRQAAGHWLGDLHKRFAGSGICALTIVKRRNGSCEFLMMDRSLSQVHTSPGTLHIRPAGELQPVTDKPDHWGDELNLWDTLLRESAEEIGGLHLPRCFQSREEMLSIPGVNAILDAVDEGTWKTYYLGFGFDPLNYKPEFLLCSVIEEDTFRNLFPGFQADFSEGSGTQGCQYGVTFAHSSIEILLSSPRIQPAAAACLALANRSEEILLKD